MWKKIKIDESEFLIKHLANGSSHKILVTNFIDLWFEDIEETQLIVRCKELNKLIEAGDDVLLRNIVSLVSSEDGDRTITRTFCDDGNRKVLTLQTSLEGFKFKFKTFLAAANSFQFYEEVTCHLLTMISELEKRHNLLVNVIKSKDLEVQEYRMECGPISRKAVETEKFDLEVFSTKCTEDLSAVKSNIIAQPSYVLTPLVQDLMVKISAAPVNEITKQNASEQEDPVEKKRAIIKLKSPSRSKRLKLYEDDEEIETISGENHGKEETKVKHEIQSRQKQTCKIKSKPKFQKILPNL